MIATTQQYQDFPSGTWYRYNFKTAAVVTDQERTRVDASGALEDPPKLAPLTGDAIPNGGQSAVAAFGYELSEPGIASGPFGAGKARIWVRDNPQTPGVKFTIKMGKSESWGTDGDTLLTSPQTLPSSRLNAIEVPVADIYANGMLGIFLLQVAASSGAQALNYKGDVYPSALMIEIPRQNNDTDKLIGLRSGFAGRSSLPLGRLLSVTDTRPSGDTSEMTESTIGNINDKTEIQYDVATEIAEAMSGGATVGTAVTSRSFKTSIPVLGINPHTLSRYDGARMSEQGGRLRASQSASASLPSRFLLTIRYKTSTHAIQDLSIPYAQPIGTKIGRKDDAYAETLIDIVATTPTQGSPLYEYEQTLNPTEIIELNFHTTTSGAA